MGEQRKFSHSSLKTFRRCRYRYFLHYVQNYDPLPSKGLVRGSVGHAALGEFYKKINLPQEERVELALKAASDELFKYDEEFQEEWDFMDLILRRYFDWASINDPFSEVIGIEEKFELTLGKHTLIGYIDGIVASRGSNWLLESKFLSQVSTKSLPLDPQVSIYLLAARKLGYNPRGVYYNIVRMAKGGIAEREPVVRMPVFRNNEGLKVIERELIAQMDEMQDFHDGMQIIYRNTIGDCSWDCGFYDVCLSLNDDGTSQSVLNKIPRSEHLPVYEEEGDTNE
jgi:RecB family exonuclease